MWQYLQDDREIVQAVEQELNHRRDALQAIEPATPMDADGEQAMPSEDDPAVLVRVTSGTCICFKD